MKTLEQVEKWINAHDEDFNKLSSNEKTDKIVSLIITEEDDLIYERAIDIFAKQGKHIHELNANPLRSFIKKRRKEIVKAQKEAELEIEETTRPEFHYRESYQGKPAIYTHCYETDAHFVDPITRDVLSDKIFETLAEVNKENPVIFARHGDLGQLIPDDFGNLSWEIIGEHGLHNELASAMRFFKLSYSNKRGVVEDLLPQAPTNIVYSILAWTTSEGFPQLKGIISYPYVCENKIWCEAGFHEETGYYLSSNFLVEPDMPNSSEEAVANLKELLIDFPFDTESSFENALAIPLSLMLNTSFNDGDMIPLGAIVASSPGTGKSELAKSLAQVATGLIPPMSSISDSREELRKEIFARLMSGADICIFDNVDPNKQIDSGMLASLVSEPIHEGRILGKSEIRRYKNNIVCLYTGNNVQTTFELVDRAYMIRLDSPPERSYQREFTHESLTGYIRENRPKLLGSLLFMVQKWLDEGSPLSDHRHRMRHWAKTIGGILQINGLGEHFLENNIQFRRTADTESTPWARAFNLIYEVFGDNPFSIDDIFKIVSYHDAIDEPNEDERGYNILGSEIAGNNSKYRKVSAGKKFMSRVGQTLGDYRLNQEPSTRLANQFSLKKVERKDPKNE